MALLTAALNGVSVKHLPTIMAKTINPMTPMIIIICRTKRERETIINKIIVTFVLY